MRWGDPDALPDTNQVANVCHLVTGIESDPDGITFRSLEVNKRFSETFPLHTVSPYFLESVG